MKKGIRNAGKRRTAALWLVLEGTTWAITGSTQC
jgi:hypothetical protein